jgi:hypothetical protein
MKRPPTEAASSTRRLRCGGVRSFLDVDAKRRVHMVEGTFNALYEPPTFIRTTEPVLVSPIEQRNRHARERVTTADAIGSDLPNYFAAILVNDIGKYRPRPLKVVS